MEKIGFMRGTLPNSGKLVVDDASWLPMVMPAGCKDRRFGLYPGECRLQPHSHRIDFDFRGQEISSVHTEVVQQPGPDG